MIIHELISNSYTRRSTGKESTVPVLRIAIEELFMAGKNVHMNIRVKKRECWVGLYLIYRLQHLFYFLEPEGFGDKAIHAGIQASLFVFRHGIGGERNDRNIRLGPRETAYGARGGISIHLGH